MQKGILFLLLLICTSLGFSQSNKTVNVNKDIDLIKVYMQVVKEGYGTPEIYKELANAYYFKSEYANSKQWYEKLFSEAEDHEEVIYHRYKQSLKALGVYSEENEYLLARTEN